MTWEKLGVADITGICQNCPEEKSIIAYNRSYRLQSLVIILPRQLARYLSNKILVKFHVSEDVFRPLPLHDSVIIQCNLPEPRSLVAL
jgi:hypothetical protein